MNTPHCLCLYNGVTSARWLCSIVLKLCSILSFSEREGSFILKVYEITFLEKGEPDMRKQPTINASKQARQRVSAFQWKGRWESPLAGYLFISPWLLGFFS